MFDKNRVYSLLIQVYDWLIKIQNRGKNIKSPLDFIDSEEGEQIFDSICMLFIAIGENLKRIDQITEEKLLSKYPEADWDGAMGFRDIVAHQYFQIDEEEVYAILKDDLPLLIQAVERVKNDIE